MKRALLFAVALAVPVVATAQGTWGPARKDSDDARAKLFKLYEDLVGSSYWVYPQQAACKGDDPKIRQQLEGRGPYYLSEEPYKLTVKEVLHDRPGPVARVTINDEIEGFTEAYRLPLGTMEAAEANLVHRCVMPWDPSTRAGLLANLQAAKMASYDAEAREAAERAKRPRPRIGMSKRQVIERSSWGGPDRVNRTTTARGTREQWVYQRGYLYFEGDRLVTIQD